MNESDHQERIQNASIAILHDEMHAVGTIEKLLAVGCKAGDRLYPNIIDVSFISSHRQ